MTVTARSRSPTSATGRRTTLPPPRLGARRAASCATAARSSASSATTDATSRSVPIRSALCPTSTTQRQTSRGSARCREAQRRRLRPRSRPLARGEGRAPQAAARRGRRRAGAARARHRSGLSLVAPAVHEELHEFQPQYHAWASSVHASVRCEQCHVKPGLVPQTAYRAYMLGQFYVSLVARSTPPKAIGTAAHQRGVPELPPGLPHRLAVRRPQHPAPRPCRRAQARLRQCHGYLVHDKNPEGNNKPRMETCLTCHDGKKAKNSCATCHTSKAAPGEPPGEGLGRGAPHDAGEDGLREVPRLDRATGAPNATSAVRPRTRRTGAAATATP